MELSKSKLSIRNTLTAAAIAAGLLMSGSANAANQCKGLDNSACKAESSCSWVNGYERKDGKTVKSFCRSKGKAKDTTKVTTKIDK